jgi:hypothetical protein
MAELTLPESARHAARQQSFNRSDLHRANDASHRMGAALRRSEYVKENWT